MRYRQLTLDERYQIQVLHKAGAKITAIARDLDRHPSTISRELRRNMPAELTDQRYLAERAARLTRKRRIEKGARSRKVQGKLQVVVEGLLMRGWSPEQISGRLRVERGCVVSHETIYQHILRDAQRRGVLRYCLRFGGYKHFRFKKSKMAERTRMRKHWIDQRPAAANERREIGHWERDCVLGKRGGAALLTIIDRRSRYARIRHVARVCAADVAAATHDALASHVTKTLTNDNGVEFQQSSALEAALRIPIYFTEPSSPWQRGSIENLNGLIRQYVGKGTDLDRAPEWLPQALEDTLNHRPRKTLGYRTPHEVFFKKRLAMILNQRMHFGLEFSP